CSILFLFFFQAEDGIRDFHVTGVQTCALPIFAAIALTLRKRSDVKRNRPSDQVKAQAKDRLRLVSIPSQTEAPSAATGAEPAQRSEERRVGKECRSRRAPQHQTKKNQQP